MSAATTDPFTELAEVYDTIMAEVEYGEWAEFILHLAGERGFETGAVLDLGCGTGNALAPLAGRGLELHGVDASEAMLAVARGKLPSVRFTRATFTDFELRRRFELVISVFDSLNNLLTDEDFSVMAERVLRHLRPGGLFVFDANTPTGLRDLWEGGKAEGWADDVYYSWVHSYDERSGLATVEAFCDHPGGNFTEVHTERGYDAASLERLLLAAGFTSVECLQYPDGAPAAGSADRLWVVARR